MDTAKVVIRHEMDYMDVWKIQQDLTIALKRGEAHPRDEQAVRLASLCQSLNEYDAVCNRRGHWFPLCSGRRFWPEDPQPSDIDIEDIAHSLSLINRFNGHTRVPYSVAQHSVEVARLLPEEYQLFGLLHDAGECYLGDVITPIKRLCRDFYEPLEHKVMTAVARRFAFAMNSVARRAVKRADLKMLMTEIRDLTPSGVYAGMMEMLPREEKIQQCWPARTAELTFRLVFEQLFARREAVRTEAREKTQAA